MWVTRLISTLDINPQRETMSIVNTLYQQASSNGDI